MTDGKKPDETSSAYKNISLFTVFDHSLNLLFFAPQTPQDFQARFNLLTASIRSLYRQTRAEIMKDSTDPLVQADGLLKNYRQQIFTEYNF